MYSCLHLFTLITFYLSSTRTFVHVHCMLSQPTKLNIRCLVLASGTGAPGETVQTQPSCRRFSTNRLGRVNNQFMPSLKASPAFLHPQERHPPNLYPKTRGFGGIEGTTGGRLQRDARSRVMPRSRGVSLVEPVVASITPLQTLPQANLSARLFGRRRTISPISF